MTKILAIDDNNDNLITLGSIVKDFFPEVIFETALSGKSGIEIAISSDPDVIFLDIIMSEMDGFEVCFKLKQDERTRDIPVVFIASIKEDRKNRIKALEVGGEAFLYKPIDETELVAQIRAMVKIKFANRQKRKQAELALEKPMVVLPLPIKDSSVINFDEIFNLSEIQKLQDQFADAFGVASIITHPDGTPITRPSNFCRLCNDIIRGTELGLKNCMHSDAVLGKHNPNNPVIQPCLSGGLWDAGASITVGGLHLANWLIGQVRNNNQNEQDLKEYAKKIGADEQEFMKAHAEVTVMSEEQFRKVSEVLFTMSGQISQLAYQNVQQAKFINERKQTEAALLESEERFRTTLYSIGDGVITTDREGRIGLMNPLAEQLTGWKQPESVGKPLEEVFRIINEQSREMVEIPVRRVLREGLVVGLANHTLLIAKDGNEIPIADSGAPIRNEKGDIVGVVLVFRDQTEEREAEWALRESEEKFRSVIEFSPIGKHIYHLQNDGKLIFIGTNPSADRILGIDHKTLIGKTIQQAFPNLANTNVPEMYTSIAKGELETQSFEIEYAENQINGFFQVTVFKVGENNVVVDFDDISDRKKAELALQESEFFFRESQRAASIGSYIHDLNTGRWTSSEVLDQIFGIDKDYIRSVDGWESLIHPDDLEMMDHHFKVEVVAERKPFNKEYRIVRKSDGAVRWIFGLGQLTFDDQGNMISMIGTIQDITERKLTEEIIKENEERFRNLFEDAAVGISMTGIDGTIRTNKTFSQILGYTPEEFQNKNWKEITHPDDIQGSLDVVNSLLQGKEDRIRFEKRYLHKNGNIVLTEVSTTLHRDINNNPQYFITSVNNITERKEAEESLRRNERKFRALIENSSDAISLVDTNGIEFYHSSSCEQIMGYSAEERNGKSMMELVHPDDLGTLMGLFGKLLQQPGTENIPPTRIHHRDGSWIWIEGVANNLLADPDVQAIVINFRDVTDRKQFEIKLQRSEQELKKAQQITHIGSWYLNLADNEVIWTEELYKMYGFDPNSPVPHYTEHKKLFTAESWELLSTSLANTAETGIPYELELKTVREDGSNGWMWVLGEAVKDAEGKTVALWGAAQDISARKHAEQLLQKSEYQYRSLFDQASDGIFISNAQGNYVDVNLYGCAMLGYSREEILKLNIKDIVEREDEASNPIKYKEMREQHVATAERLLVCKNGDLLPVEISGKMLDDGRFQGIVRDISERKQAEKAILEEKNLLRTLINNLPVMVYVKDNEARKIVANTLDLATIGIMDETAVVGKTDLELFDNEIGQRGYEDDLNVIRTAKPVLNREEYFFSDNGEKHWMLTSKMPLFDENGKPTGLVGIGRDITEQKKANETIQKLTKSIEQSPSTIVITDISGQIEYVNPKFTEITGYTLEEAKGQNPRILKSGEMPTEKYKELWDAISSGEVWRGEFHNRKKNGELYWEWATITSIKNELGVITNYIAIKEDISVQKQMQFDLIVAKEKAEESDRLKSAFLANMSHEIRTPLNSIIGFSELLSDSDFETEQKQEFISHIIINGNNLLNIISDIIDISKIESSELRIHKRKISVQKFVSKISNQFAILFEGKSIEFIVDLPIYDDEVTIFADEDRLIQVFSNLISNAIKFTEEGSVQIGYQSNGNNVEFHVKDTGIGIPVEYHDKIFERFRQVEDSTTRKYGGNGLGLAITRNLINLMDGEIGLESVPGVGSTFYFTIPKMG